jgi:hypothetical protein
MITHSQLEVLAPLLEEARRQGVVHIQGEDGQVFVLQPEHATDRSPFDIEGLDLGLTREEILEAIHEGRDRY